LKHTARETCCLISGYDSVLAVVRVCALGLR
jgi:hypothetical protein